MFQTAPASESVSGVVPSRRSAWIGSRGPRRYEVTELLGRGGMGEVHLAFDERVGRDVALKVLSGGGSRSEHRSSFLREARLQGVLDHPGIVPVHDVDRDAQGRDFFVMKRVVGTTLEEVVRRMRDGDAALLEKYPLRRLLSAYLQVCLTVDYAHSRGVVHRDLKPSNLMLGDYGEVYVLDWGIAKVAGSEGLAQVLRAGAAPHENFTNATDLLGTPGHMAPEQIEDSTRVDARTDVYSLGVVLFGLLTLERLHRGGNAFEILESTRLGVDARPSVRAPDRGLPPEYDAICARATAVDPAERYPNVRELHDAVARVLDGDRDMRLRVELGAKHLAEAKEALSAEGLSGLTRADAHRVALRHAARSLALHPQGKEAAALVSTLMLTPPDEAPPEVEQETRDIDAETHLRNARSGAAVALGLLGLVVGIMAWLGVRSWSAVALTSIPLLLSLVLSTSARVASMGVHRAVFASAVCIAVSVAGTSSLLGSLWFPFTCALFYGSLVSWNHGLGRWRIACVAVVLMGAVTPCVLELAGIITSQYVFVDRGILIRPNMVAFPPGRADVALALGQAAAIILTVAAFFRFSRMNVETRRRLQMMAWHLRALAPSADDDTEITAAMAPIAYHPPLPPEDSSEAPVTWGSDTDPTYATLTH